MIYEEFLLNENDLYIYNRKDRTLFQQVGNDCKEIKDPKTYSRVLTSNAKVLSKKQVVEFKKKQR